jgi:hypothetical protein
VEWILILLKNYFRQDLQDFQDFFAFPRSAGQAAERQKPISLFEGVHFGIKAEQRSEMYVLQQYHRPLWLSFPAGSGMAISRFRPRPPRKRERCGQAQLASGP